MTITTRQTSAEGVVNKNSPLTNAEVDGNFIDLKQNKYEAGDSPDFANVSADSVALDTSNIVVPTAAGTMVWSQDDETVVLTLDGEVPLPLGEKCIILAKADEAITKGDVVYASSAVGNSGKIGVSKYIANNTIPSRMVIGIAASDIVSGEFGYVTAFGSVKKLDTTGTTAGETWTSGTILYASPTTAGKFTSTRPVAPNQDIAIAFVINAHANNGVLFVRAFELGQTIGDLHDVYTNGGVDDKDLLQYNSAAGRWEPVAVTTTDIGEGTNLYYTVTRANAAIDARVTKAFIDALGVAAASVPWTGVTGKPATFPPSAHTHAISDVTGLQTALNAKVAIADIINNLTSNNTDKPLSANQGLILKTAIDNINAILTSDDTTLDELQEIVDYIKQNRSDLDALGISNIAGLQAALDTKVDKITGKGLSTEDYTTAEKSKLAGIAAGAQVNVATNLTYSTAATTGTVNSSTGTNATIPAATTSLAGLMTNTDKSKLDGIAAGANNYSHPTYAGDDINLDTGPLTGATVISDLDFNVTTDTLGHVTDANATYSTRNLTAADVGAAAASHTHTIANVTGLQSALDGKQATLGFTPVNKTGDTMTGNLNISLTNSPTLNLVDNSPVAGNGGMIIFSSTPNVGQDVQIRYNLFDSERAPFGIHIERGPNNNQPENDTYLQVEGLIYSNNTQRVYADDYHPNADKLTTARSISLTGDVTGSTTFDGSGNVSITATVADDSHNHVISNIDGLQSALDGKSNVGHTHAISDVTGLQDALDNAGGGGVYSANPVFIMRDTDSTGAAQTGFFSFQNSGSTETAWVGFGSAGNTDFGVRNTIGAVRINGSYTLADNSVRSPIFYDSNNTAYYTDPASTSSLNALNMAGDLNITKNFPKIVLDSSSSGSNTNEQGASISLGESGFGGTATLHITYTGDGFGHIGMGSLSSTNSLPSLRALRFYYQDRDVYADTRITAGADFRAPIFYDSNNTGYYVDPASTSNLNSLTLAGKTTVGTFPNSTTNTGEAWFGRATDRSIGTYTLQLGGNSTSGRSFEVVDYAWSSVMFQVNSANYAQAAGSMRAPLFYDSNNTGYYVDPASTSNTNAMRASEYRGNANVGGTGEAIWCPAGIYSGGTQWLYGTMFRNGSATYHNGGSLYEVNRIECTHNYGEGVFGVYSATRYQHVWSMGTAYKLASNGTSVGNLYGLSWTHPNVGTGTDQAIAGLSHQLQLRENGSLKCAFGAGIWTSGNVTAYSDIAVKTNLEKIPDALNKVMQINGYTYDRTDFSPDPLTGTMPETRQAGVVAQEVEKILPEVVSGQEGNKAVAYGNMVALLIEAIKEQQTQIEALTSEINTLKEKIK